MALLLLRRLLLLATTTSLCVVVVVANNKYDDAPTPSSDATHDDARALLLGGSSSHVTSVSEVSSATTTSTVNAVVIDDDDDDDEAVGGFITATLPRMPPMQTWLVNRAVSGAVDLIDAIAPLPFVNQSTADTHMLDESVREALKTCCERPRSVQFIGHQRATTTRLEVRISSCTNQSAGSPTRLARSSSCTGTSKGRQTTSRTYQIWATEISPLRC